MKTNAILLFLLFIGIGFTNLSAQDEWPLPKNAQCTGSVSYYYTWDAYWQTAFCDGGQIDRLEGTVSGHMVDHYKNGVWLWAKQDWSGEAKSIYTDEVFKVSAPNTVDAINGVTTWHFNLIGNKGSHYIGTATAIWADWPNYTIDKMICLEKKH
jgi:hypothetical protein